MVLKVKSFSNWKSTSQRKQWLGAQTLHNKDTLLHENNHFGVRSVHRDNDSIRCVWLCSACCGSYHYMSMLIRLFIIIISIVHGSCASICKGVHLLPLCDTTSIAQFFITNCAPVLFRWWAHVQDVGPPAKQRWLNLLNSAATADIFLQLVDPLPRTN